MSAGFNTPHLMGNCENCYYFTPDKYEEHPNCGICHRYPMPINRLRFDYCGEFAWKSDAPHLKGVDE